MHAFAMDERNFQRALWMAASLHLALFLLLGLLNLKTTPDFPFQIVNIRLGGDGSQKKISDVLQSADLLAASDKNKNASSDTDMQVAETVSKTIAEPAPAPSSANTSIPAPVPHSKPAPKPETSPQAQTWRRSRGKDEQFRPVARTLDDYLEKGDAAGGSSIAGFTPESDAAVTRRYTQVLSLWLYKFRDYPEQARKAGISGKALIRLRIDRTGRVLFYQLDRSTGHPVLDSAIRDMVYRASPVPEVPGHFPGGQQLEFLIPIAFSLD